MHHALTSLTAISSVDGRYGDKTTDLRNTMSEFGLIKYRLYVMTEYLIAFGEQTRSFRLSDHETTIVRSIAKIDVETAIRIKNIERVTNHDVKACERYLREQFDEHDLKRLIEWLHFGLTSEDVNNIAYAIMLQEGKLELYVAIEQIRQKLDSFAIRYSKLAMLARTHGQPATPTTLGKEFRVFESRIAKLNEKLLEFPVEAKLNSASGNYNALVAAYPGHNWVQFTATFIALIGKQTGHRLIANLVTTQIEPHDSYAELFDLLKRVNVVLMDLVQDLWRYVSDDWLVQKRVEGEVGSSIMPHKVNPIDLENAEGNMGGANALFEFFSRKLPVSRLQRDLSDSTVERMFGTAFGFCLVAYKAIAKGLDKISANEVAITAALEDRWEVLAEYYQTMLRRVGYPDPYSALKSFARGKQITREDCMEFIDGLDGVDDQLKKEMRKMTPLTYVGLAPELAGNVQN